MIVLMLLQKSIRRLKLSAKDEKIKTESERTKADPSKLDAWMKQQASNTSERMAMDSSSFLEKIRETNWSKFRRRPVCSF